MVVSLTFLPPPPEISATTVATRGIDGQSTMAFRVRSLRADEITAAIWTFVQRARPDSRYVVARR
jgi:hypothetical protein